MKILMLGWELPPHNSGGLGIASYALAKTLTEKGVEVIFLLPEKMNYGATPFKLFFADREKGLKIKGKVVNAYGGVEIFSGGRRLASAEKGYIGDFVKKVFDYSANAAAFAKKREIDIIHAHDWLTGVAGVRVKKEKKKPLIIHIHATEIDRAGSNPNPLIFSLEKEVMEKADKVVAVSQFTKNIITEYYGITPEKIAVVHNGFNLENPKSEIRNPKMNIPLLDGKKVVLFVGRITMQKGPDYLLQAAKKVLEVRDDVLFLFAGSGDMEGQIIQEACKLGVMDNIVFAGFLRGDDLNEVYKKANLFVMPSVSEPFGLTALEASSHNLPAILSRRSGAAEVMSHTLRIDFWDIDDIASKILSILEYPALQQELAKNGFKEVSALDWSAQAQKLMGIYQELCFSPST